MTDRGVERRFPGGKDLGKPLRADQAPGAHDIRENVDGETIHVLMASTSMLMSTFSPTSKPPASSATFHVRPKSLRLMEVFAEKPTRSPPHGSFTRPAYSTS